MTRIPFNIGDVSTPQGIERTLRLFEAALDQLATGMGGTGGMVGGSKTSTPAVSLNDLVSQLAPLLRNQLQAPGGSPLNLTALLPAQGQGILLEDTHANRLTLYPASNYSVGTLFYETDRKLVYAVVSSSGTLVWQYIDGVYYDVFANRPTDLATNDTGVLYIPSEHLHWCRWGGAAWTILDPDAGIFVDSAVALGAGWQVCDGTATTYLTIAGAGLAQTAFTTPDEVTAPSGVYHKSIAAYTGTINAPTAGAISGSTANTTATNQAAATGVTIVDHPSHTHDDASSLATPDLFAPDTTATGVAGRTGGPSAVLAHPVTDPTHNHTQNAHLHAAGTLAVATTGEPRNMGVLRYFRR